MSREARDPSVDGAPSFDDDPSFESEPRYCSIANALEVLGDRWSLLVLREVHLGVRRFSEIQRRTGAPREMLSARLRKLVAAGVIEQRAVGGSGRSEYALTEAGEGTSAVLRQLRLWGEHYVTPPGRITSARPRHALGVRAGEHPKSR